MTYEEAVEQSEKISWKVIFRGKNYLPYHLPIEKVIPAPKDARRFAQFMELFTLYREDWLKTAAHFQLEMFDESVIFRSGDEIHFLPFNEFRRLNKIHILCMPNRICTYLH